MFKTKCQQGYTLQCVSTAEGYSLFNNHILPSCSLLLPSVGQMSNI